MNRFNYQICFSAKPVLNASLAQGKRKFLFRSFCHVGQASLQDSGSLEVTFLQLDSFGPHPRRTSEDAQSEFPFPVMGIILYVFDSAKILPRMNTPITGIVSREVFLSSLLRIDDELKLQSGVEH